MIVIYYYYQLSIRWVISSMSYRPRCQGGWWPPGTTNTKLSGELFTDIKIYFIIWIFSRKVHTKGCCQKPLLIARPRSQKVSRTVSSLLGKPIQLVHSTHNIQCVPKKRTFFFLGYLDITPIWKGLGKKVGCVSKNWQWMTMNI